MKYFNKIIKSTLWASILVFGLTGPITALAATPVNLATAGNFVILAGSTVTNVPTSTITGNVGLSPASGSFYSGLTAGEVTGSIYAVNGAGPAGSINNPGLLTIAKNDLTAAYLDAEARTPTTTFVAGDNQLGGQTLTPGVYRFPSAATANITAANPLKLDAQNNPSAVFILQATSDLVTAAGSVVQLINGAQACNVYWQVDSSATLGSNSTFVGNIMALTSATLTTGANVTGRVMARNGAVTMQSNTVTRSVCAAATSTTTNNSAPKFPNTGTEPTGNLVLWQLSLLASVIAAAGAFAVARRKHVI